MANRFHREGVSAGPRRPRDHPKDRRRIMGFGFSNVFLYTMKVGAPQRIFPNGLDENPRGTLVSRNLP
jgi:hypothetical protein